MASGDILREALDERIAAFRKALKACREDPSEPAVHDLRAAMRRLLAALELLEFVLPQRRLQKLSGELKDQLDDLDDLRDTQAMLAAIPEQIDLVPELVPLEDFLKRREKRLLRAARRQVDALDSRAIQRRLRKADEELEEQAQGGLPEEALDAVDNAYSMVMQHYRDIDPSQPASIHQVRIAFRKFRYMLEMIHAKLRGFPEDQLERMRDYQTRMGALQDATIFLATLDQFAGAQEPYDPQPVRQFYERKAEEGLSEYMAAKEDIKSFWRAMPEAELPWRPASQRGTLPMKLYIVRHAIAVDEGTPGYEDDSQRPLTDEGRKKMKRVARGLREFGVEFDQILTSPYVRARDTAQILADEFNLEKRVAFSDRLIPPGDFDGLVDEISEKYDVDSLALVGHEPMLSQLISWLVTGGTEAPVTLKKGGVGCLTVENLRGRDRRATLEWLLTPAALIALGK
ncbi:MAG: phosphohistidine phosphatase SixA [Bacteroidota bacterium]